MKEKIRKSNYSPRMLREIQSMEDCSSPLNNAEPIYSTKIWIERRKRPTGERIVWFEDRRQDGLCLYVLRKIFLHKDYEKNFKNIEKVREWEMKHDYDELEELEIEDTINRYRNPNSAVLNLPQEWYPYEEEKRNFHNKDNDIIVYESKEWIESFAEIKDRTVQEMIRQSLGDFVSGNEIWSKLKNVPGIDNSEFRDLLIGDKHITMRIDASNKVLQSVFLLSIDNNPNYNLLKNMNYNSCRFDELKKKMKRCYPGLFFLDDGPSSSEIKEMERKRGQRFSEDDRPLPLWLMVERDKEGQANLILSPEEKDILNKANYPFFINGLAGSGKSTLLYYLFACIYAYQHEKYPSHSLLFLSYSNRLVQKARDYVASILRLNSKFMDQENVHIKEDLEDFIKPFRQYLRNNFLTEEERFGLFANEKYIDYEHFRSMYATSCMLKEKNAISPDIVWSVIRIYIKGYNPNYYLTPEDYKKMREIEGARKDITVDDNVYKLSYKIWNQWYKKIHTDHDCWDDLDLVRYILSQKRINKQYAAVFCDEAQDFTRVEAELIIRLSKHSLYDLSNNKDYRKIPIAFAGDPNQTINPTGFRLGSIQKIFSDIFHELVGQEIGFKEYPLEINYRSREGIVNFSNSIQFIRHKLLDNTSTCTFQQAWDNECTLMRKNSLEGFNYVSFYEIGSNNELEKHLGKALCVLTSEEGEYFGTPPINASDFEMKAAEETRKRITRIGIPLDIVKQSNVYTAITAKGLEFKSTVLYRFASIEDTKIAINAFQKVIVKKEELSDNEKYALSHFMTKLYVAVSRAKSVLFILDTNEAYERFWKYLCEPELWNKYIQLDYLTSDDKVALGLLYRPKKGNIDDYTTMLNENFNPSEEAERLFLEALDSSNPETMKRARDYYDVVHDEYHIQLCEAYYAFFSGNFTFAGNLFLKINKNIEAIEAFWKAGSWKDLSNDIKEDCMQKFVADFMTDKITVRQFLQEWNRFYENIRACLSDTDNAEQLWKTVVNKILVEVRKINAFDINTSLISSLDEFSSVVGLSNFEFQELMAELHYKRAEILNQGRDHESMQVDKPDYIAAINYWDRINRTQHNDYYRAQLFVSADNSSRIKWLRLLSKSDEILSRYSNINIAYTLTDEAAGIVFTCLLSKDFAKAVAYPYPKDKNTKWNRLYTQNPARFFTDVVLEDFSLDKFYFLNDKLQKEETSLFDNKLPASLFDMIFSLNELDSNNRPFWTYFTSSLKDVHGDRVLKYDINRDNILDSLSRTIKADGNYDKQKASCFLEMLFDDNYNSRKADKFKSTIFHIFSHDVFFKEDFRRTTKRNQYFALFSDLSNDEHDTIKNNIRKYAEYYIGGLKKLTALNEKDVKSIMLAYEICTPYQATFPDYHNICGMYKKWMRMEKLDRIKEWMEHRLIFNQFLDDNSLQKASYKKLVAALQEKNYDTYALINDFSKEDSAAFVAIVNSSEDEYSFDKIFLSTKLIYTHRLRRDNLKPYCRVNDLINKFPQDIDKAIDDVLSNAKHVDEYRLKIITYAWEALFEYAFVAEHYDLLVKNPRLSRLTILTEYLKKRALLHYSHLKAKQFSDKQKEYGISMSKDYLPAIYPHIEERNVGKSSTDSKKDGEKSQNITNVSEPVKVSNQSKENKNRVSKRNGKTSGITNMDPAKMQLLDVARTLKNMGQSIDFIYQAVSMKLTIEEIAKLWEED